MDFDGAIKAHSDWKMKLSTYLRKPDGSFFAIASTNVVTAIMKMKSKAV